jgi:hypothetical protein
MTNQNIQETASNLTNNEREFLMLCLNYDTLEGQLSDNYSNGGMKEAIGIMNGNRHAAAGLLSSLTQKNLGWGEELEESGEHVFWLTELGARVTFTALNSGN